MSEPEDKEIETRARPDVRIKVHVYRDGGKIKHRLEQEIGDTHQRLKDGIIWTNDDEIFKIRFKLKDHIQQDLKFDEINDPPRHGTSADGPIWIVLGNNPKRDCPKNYFVADGFEISLDEDRTRLTVENPNPRNLKKRFIYNLRISGQGNRYDYDPVIQNGGGPPPDRSPWAILLIAVAGLAALAGIAYVAGRLG
ncbi:MAG: hypothetical protein AB7O91_08795 [Sphingomonas sp.]